MTSFDGVTLTGWRSQMALYAYTYLDLPRRQTVVDDEVRSRHDALMQLLTEEERYRQRPFSARVAALLRGGVSDSRRYETALAALLELRIATFARADAAALRAWVPELRADVKRLIAQGDPLSDTFLSILERLSTHDVDLGGGSPARVGGPAPASS